MSSRSDDNLPGWFDSKIYLAKIRAGQNIGKKKICQNFGKYFVRWATFWISTKWMPKFIVAKTLAAKFWNQTNQAL
jgi:hypothetical protein